MTGIELSSDAFNDHSFIARRYSYEGPNVSPPLAWSGVPDDAAELLLLCEDPDAPSGTFAHWVVVGIDPHSGGVEAGHCPPGGTELVNSYGQQGWGGPHPPPGDDAHHYFFRLYALSEPCVLPDAPGADQVHQEVERRYRGRDAGGAVPALTRRAQRLVVARVRDGCLLARPGPRLDGSRSTPGCPRELGVCAGYGGQAGLGRRFGWLWGAYAVSTAGTWLAFDAFALIAVLALHAGPAQVALLAAAGPAVGAVVSVPLGPWVEVRRKRPVMIATDLVRCVVLLSVPVAFALGRS